MCSTASRRSSIWHHISLRSLHGYRRRYLCEVTGDGNEGKRSTRSWLTSRSVNSGLRGVRPFISLRCRPRSVLSLTLNLNFRSMSFHFMPLSRAQMRSSSCSGRVRPVTSVIKPLSKRCEMVIVAALVGSAAPVVLLLAGWSPGGPSPAGPSLPAPPLRSWPEGPLPVCFFGGGVWSEGSPPACLFLAGWLPTGAPLAGLFREGCPPAGRRMFAGALEAALLVAELRGCRLLAACTACAGFLAVPVPCQLPWLPIGTGGIGCWTPCWPGCDKFGAPAPLFIQYGEEGW